MGNTAPITEYLYMTRFEVANFRSTQLTIETEFNRLRKPELSYVGPNRWAQIEVITRPTLRRCMNYVMKLLFYWHSVYDVIMEVEEIGRMSG